MITTKNKLTFRGEMTMDETIKAMIDALKEYGAGFISVSIGKYTIMITDDEEGAEFLKEKWDEYVDS